MGHLVPLSLLIFSHLLILASASGTLRREKQPPGIAPAGLCREEGRALTEEKRLGSSTPPQD